MYVPRDQSLAEYAVKNGIHKYWIVFNDKRPIAKKYRVFRQRVIRYLRELPIHLLTSEAGRFYCVVIQSDFFTWEEKLVYEPLLRFFHRKGLLQFKKTLELYKAQHVIRYLVCIMYKGRVLAVKRYASLREITDDTGCNCTELEIHKLHHFCIKTV